MSKLIEHAKRAVREDVGKLTTPDGDIRPTMVWTGPHGVGMMPMPMLDDAAKDQLALWMTASLTVSRADEAVAISTAYMATVEFDDPTVDVLAARTTVAAKDRPGAIEAIVLQFADHKTSGLIAAELTRYPDRPPTLGDWGEPIPEGGGRFGNAIYTGLRCSREMPQEMVDIIEAGWAAGPEQVQTLIERFVKVAQTFSRPATPGPSPNFPVSTPIPPEEDTKWPTS